MQIVFQDPYSSLNPRMTAGQIAGEPLCLLLGGRYRRLLPLAVRLAGATPDEVRVLAAWE